MLSSWKGRVVRSPLVHIIPVPEPARVERFRGAWDARNGRETVLFAGQIRRDKRLDLLIESATSWPPHRTLAVVGEDRGDWDRCAALAERLGVRLHATLGFQPLEDPCRGHRGGRCRGRPLRPRQPERRAPARR